MSATLPSFPAIEIAPAPSVDWAAALGEPAPSLALTHAPILAQQFEETDLAGQVQDAWGTFVETGQIWALAIGLILGYMFRTFTS